MPVVRITQPDSLGPSWRLGALVDVSPERAARWLARGWVEPASPQEPEPPPPDAAPALTPRRKKR